MATRPHEPLLLGHVRKLLAAGAAAARPDRELVERFAQARDEEAFEALVRRHGPMVFRVCRRVLGRAHEAEDAFQATFLVLARKAASLRDQASVGSWLYGVASRVALKARTSVRLAGPAARRPAAGGGAGPLEELTLAEARAALDEELARLPEKYRGPLVLCCLEGRARDEAALELGLPLSTLKSRLEQARELLRRRLARRGLGLPAVLSAALLTGEAAAVPAALLRATARCAVLFESGLLGAEAPAPAGALALAKGALNVMPTGKLIALSAAALFALALAAAGAAMRRPAAAPAAPAVAAADPAGRLTELARRIWAVTELVAKHHPAPPARATMLAEAAEALRKQAGLAPPADLLRLAGEVAGPEQLAAFLKSVWPPDGAGKKAAPDALAAAALRGLLRSVPGEPNLLSASEVRVNSQVSANRYVGIGIQIGRDEKAKRAVVVDPFRRGTAYKAGVKPRDLIVRVDGKDTHGVPLMKVVDWLRGEEGTAVEIEVRQPGEDKGRTYTITRAPVPFDTVFGYRSTGDGWRYRIDPGRPAGYVHVGSITSSTLHELRQAERRLRAEGGRAVVLDLRFSGGGELHNAGLVAGGLLDRKLLWRVRDARGGVKESRSGGEALFRGWPMAVLVNAQIPGKAAQAVAAALQDAGRAVVVGERTTMDGYVNSLLPLPEGGFSLTLRTGRLERAARGRGWPVEPDHPVALDKAGASAVLDWLRAKGRSDLTPGADKPPSDPQLARAVEVVEAAARKAGEEK
jgi:C-terminal peptidase prc